MRNSEKAKNSERPNEKTLTEKIERLLTIYQLATILGVSVRTAWRLDKEQKIPAFACKIGHQKRWDPDDIELWIEWKSPDRKTFNQFKKERTRNGKKRTETKKRKAIQAE